MMHAIHGFAGLGRVWRRHLALSVGSFLCLALGIAAASSVFAVVDHVLFRPLDYPLPERLTIAERMDQRGGAIPVSYDDFLIWRDACHAFEMLGAIRLYRVQILIDGNSVPVNAAVASSEIFELLGVEAYVGRLFEPEDDRLGSSARLLVSHSLWTTALGGMQDLARTSISLGGVPFTLQGVIRKGVRLPETFPTRQIDIWLPLGASETQASTGHLRYSLLARLSPSSTLRDASAELSNVRRPFPSGTIEPKWHWRVVNLLDRLVIDVRTALLLLLGGVLLFLFLTGVNLANLSLVRISRRSGEMGIREALGAGRLRLIGLVLLDVASLALLGGVAGILLSHWSLQALVALGPGNLPRLQEVVIDFRIAAVGVVSALAVGLGASLFPMFRYTSGAFMESIRPGATFSQRSGRYRRLLVVAQVALATILLTVAGLFSKNFLGLVGQDLGFRPEGVTAMRLIADPGKYDAPSRKQLYDRILKAIRALPDVQSAAAVEFLPFGGLVVSHGFDLSGPGTALADGESVKFSTNAVSSDYFRTLGIPIVEGGDLVETTGRIVPALVNQSFARRVWGDRNPLERELTMGKTTYRIVGVTKDAKRNSLKTGVVLEHFVPLSARSPMMIEVLVRSEAPLEMLSPQLRRKVAQVEPNISVRDVRRLQDLVTEGVRAERLFMWVFSFFGVAAMLVSAIGTYAVVASFVSLRGREIGIRLALGAEKADVIRRVVGFSLILTVSGLVIGLVAVMGLSAIVGSLLHDVEGNDPQVLTLALLLLLLVSVLAAVFPAISASRLDPAQTLKIQ